MGAGPIDRLEVAVVVPAHSARLSDDEAVSLKHLKHFLRGRDKFLAMPEGLEFDDPDLTPVYFDPSHFRDANTYSQLALSEEFFLRFRQYRYMLIYQLDCLVFSDRLSEWCAKGFDFVGAPWIRSPDLSWTYKGPERVGNAGFCLHHIARTLETIRRSNRTGYLDVWRALLMSRPGHLLGDIKKALLLKRNAASRYPGHNDIWWGFYAQDYFPEFRIPSVEQALEFAFEVSPRQCFERNGQRLPFGCHAWARYDRSFWAPYLLK